MLYITCLLLVAYKWFKILICILLIERFAYNDLIELLTFLAIDMRT